MDRLLLVASTFCFLLGFAYTMYALGAGRYRSSRIQSAVIVAGFTLQTVFLYQRGQVLGRCPLTNAFEVLIFLGWSMVLLYLLIGSSYRLSLLGVFTSPVVFALQAAAMMLPIDVPAAQRPETNSWLELHAALSVIAYGAFALAGVAGVMYLVQERQLKTHQIRSMFFYLPPIADLFVANRRLVLAGFAMLTIGLLAGFAVGGQVSWSKIGWSSCVWGLYGVLLAVGFSGRLSPRKTALFSVMAFALTFLTLWGIHSAS